MIGGAIAMGATPLLLVYVPAGIILVTASVAFSEGLRHHIHRLMGVPTPQTAQEAEAESSQG